MLLIHNTSFVYQLTPAAQRGGELGTLNPVPNGAVLLDGERILSVGSPAELLLQHPEADLLDAGGNAVVPGFVDPHTHLVWAGDRANEFEMRLQGKTYMEIMAAGGGIVATLKATRAASPEQLLEETRPRAGAFRHGTPQWKQKPVTGWTWKPSTSRWKFCCAWMKKARCRLSLPTWARTLFRLNSVGIRLGMCAF